MICANCHEDVHDGPMGGKSAMHRRQSVEARAKRAASLKKYWDDPEHRAARAEIAREIASRPGVNARRSSAMRERHRVAPEHIAAMVEGKRLYWRDRLGERDARIVALSRAGMGLTAIAREMGLSHGSVAHVLRRDHPGRPTAGHSGRPVDQERDEAIVRLRREGWTQTRIAAEVGCHPATVRNRLRRHGVT